MPSIIHIADLHFGSMFTSSLPQVKAQRRRLELYKTFSHLIDLAKEEQTNILLIAGDLFNSTTVHEDTINFLKRKFAEIPATKVFIAAGNHDFIGDDCPYHNTNWGDNVHIFGNVFSKFELDEFNTEVYGVSQTKPYNTKSLLTIGEVDASKTNILVMHGDVVSNGGSSQYNPIFEDDIERCGMNYVALGHVHKNKGICKSGEVHWAYSGVLEGRGFDETGDKGFIIGKVHKNEVDLAFRPISRRRYFVLEFDLTGCRDAWHITEMITEQALEKGTKDDLYKFILRGKVAPELSLNFSELTELFFYVKIINNLEHDCDYTEIAQEKNLKGKFVSFMLEEIFRSDNERKEITKLALDYGYKALLNGEINID